ncbi:MAG: hypothetical protein ACOH2I_02180 [Pseudomonas sp.]
MLLSKRDLAHRERQLVAGLTQACETGKAEILGFTWLTHQVDYQKCPSSLTVTWIFDTQANRDRALANGQSERMAELTAEAFSEAGISVSTVSAHLAFDSEEQCQRVDAGNWQQRLARQRSSKR